MKLKLKKILSIWFAKDFLMTELKSPPEIDFSWPMSLDKNNVYEYLNRVFYLQNQWIKRDAWTGLSTLGLASYIDGMHFLSSEIKNNHCAMDSNFGDLQEIIRQSLETYLDLEIILHPNLPRPGFHIFEYYPAPAVYAMSPHFDQYWNQSNGEAGNHLTLTLPIALPSQGTTLQVWNRHVSQGPVDFETENLTSIFIPYQLGVGVLHSGVWLHAVPQTALPQKPDEWRITYQVHMERQSSGFWYMFW